MVLLYHLLSEDTQKKLALYFQFGGPIDMKRITCQFIIPSVAGMIPVRA